MWMPLTACRALNLLRRAPERLPLDVTPGQLAVLAAMFPEPHDAKLLRGGFRGAVVQVTPAAAEPVVVKLDRREVVSREGGGRMLLTSPARWRTKRARRGR